MAKYGSGLGNTTLPNGTGTNVTNGNNVRVDALREKAIRTAKKEIIFEQLCDSQTMPLNYGKTLKVHKTLYILDDNNQTVDGLDQQGFGPGNLANPTGTDDEGNLYGSSRSIYDIENGLPLIGEGAGRVNRVGMTRITLQGTLIRMGAFLEYTDEVELFSDQKMEVQYYEKMGELAAELYDDYLQKELLNAAQLVKYAGTATNINTIADTSVLSYDNIRDMQIDLRKNYAKKTNAIITGSTKIGTVPVNASWFAYCGPTSTVELEKMKDDFNERAYTPARMYAAAGNLAKNETGAVHSTRFIEAERMMTYDGAGAAGGTPNGFQVTTLTAAQRSKRLIAGTGGAAGDFFDAFPILWVTKGAFATIGLQGNKKIKFLSRKPGKDALPSDPYALMGLYSFNFFVGSIALEPEKIGKLLHAAK